MSPVEKANLIRKVRRYEERLSEGWDLIDQRKNAGHDISALEDFFILLLGEYQEACDELNAITDRQAA